MKKYCVYVLHKPAVSGLNYRHATKVKLNFLTTIWHGSARKWLFFSTTYYYHDAIIWISKIENIELKGGKIYPHLAGHNPILTIWRRTWGKAAYCKHLLVRWWSDTIRHPHGGMDSKWLSKGLEGMRAEHIYHSKFCRLLTHARAVTSSIARTTRPHYNMLWKKATHNRRCASKTKREGGDMCTVIARDATAAIIFFVLCTLTIKTWMRLC